MWGLGLGSTGGNRKLQQPPSQLSTAQHGSAAQRGARDLPCWILTMVPDTARTQHNRTHNNTTAVSTTAPPPSYAYIPVYLQISTLHLVNTCSVRRYLHCTVCPTAPQVQVQSRQLSPWRQRRALLQVCSMHQGGGRGPPHPAPKEGQVFCPSFAFRGLGRWAATSGPDLMEKF